MENYKLIKNEIINLINNPDKKISFKSCIFIYGISGIGKTYTVYKICNELNLNIVNFTSSNCNNSEEFNELLFKTITAVSFLDIISAEKKEKIIVIDNYETLLSIDRTINSNLYNVLNAKKYKNIPIICICNKNLLKKIGNIKKKCKTIEYKNLLDSDIEKIILEKKPKIKKDILKNILEKCQGNVQQALFLLENYSEKNNSIDKNYDTEYLYGNMFERDIVNKILLEDSWLIPLRFHENLIYELKNRKTTLQNKNNYYKSFLFDICLFDVLMNKNCTDNAISIIISNVYFLTLIPNKKDSKPNLENFTKLLSYLSLQKKYVKKGYNYNKEFFQIGNYHINSININLYT
tara:strand:- start:1781 stop:2827 length:1047 start_codon:yes stop_codon:yes gene_type:complete